MSTPGHRPETKKRSFAKRLIPIIKNRNIVRVASFVFIGGLAVGFAVAPSPAFAARATISIEPSTSSNVIYISGNHFPSSETATIQTTVNGVKDTRRAQVRRGTFRVSVPRPSGPKQFDVVARAYTHSTSVSAKKQVSLLTGLAPASADNFGSTTTTTTTAVAAPEAVDAEAAAAQAATNGSSPDPSTTSTTAAPATVKAASVPTTSAPAAATTSGGAPAGYSLAFSDEFNGTAVDKSKWGLYEGAGNDGIGQRVPSAVSENGGELKITGHGMDGGGLASSYKATYGYYEVRSRFDAGSKGYNTATLLWPTSEKWPVDGEIDMAEIFNGDTANAGSYDHWGSNNSQVYNEYKGDFSQWHTWGVDWQPDHLTYYLDGKAFWTITNSAAIPTTPHFLGLQLDVTNGSTHVDGSAFHIDYVHIYKKN